LNILSKSGRYYEREFARLFRSELSHHIVSNDKRRKKTWTTRNLPNPHRTKHPTKRLTKHPTKPQALLSKRARTKPRKPNPLAPATAKPAILLPTKAAKTATNQNPEQPL
jgi:hypothetical protein